jgi:hypothetical protein
MFELRVDPAAVVAALGSGVELAEFVAAVPGQAGLDRVLSGLEATRRLEAWTAAEKQRAADNTELDHVRDWNNGGPTRPENLLPLCARHHHLKHETDWHLHYNPTTGVATWTSPTGRKYTNTNPPLPTGGSG